MPGDWAPPQPGAIRRLGEMTVARIVMIAYTTYIHDGRVRREAEALASRGDHVDVITLGDQPSELNGVNLVPVKIDRYRGSSRVAYTNTYLSFFAKAAMKAWSLARTGA